MQDGMDEQIDLKPPSQAGRRRGRPRTNEAAEVETALLDAAIAEFLAHGYAGANMSRLVRKAQMSTKTLYARYSGKRELFMAVVDRLVAPTATKFATLFDHDVTDIDDALRAAALQSAKHWTSRTELGLYRLLIAEAERFPELADIYLASIEPLRILTSAFLSRPEIARTLQIDDPAQAADDFGTLTTLPLREDALMGKIPDPEDVEARVSSGVARFLRLYRRQKTSTK
jgi:AcrR family transcriptional regulator